eukprot:TRINITY_DN6675_c0_g1_i1.p1 TRINITY_DN6675_c0_g1~~TRINITY_DN6675_c0_g1_i1.p1  ORF type:complete len:190 (+),score=38.92 TRINITY_DN6675_c0_g1_i1:117-686(+)
MNHFLPNAYPKDNSPLVLSITNIHTVDWEQTKIKLISSNLYTELNDLDNTVELICEYIFDEYLTYSIQSYADVDDYFTVIRVMALPFKDELVLPQCEVYLDWFVQLLRDALRTLDESDDESDSEEVSEDSYDAFLGSFLSGLIDDIEKRMCRFYYGQIDEVLLAVKGKEKQHQIVALRDIFQKIKSAFH